jgi:hypothetical protein
MTQGMLQGRAAGTQGRHARGLLLAGVLLLGGFAAGEAAAQRPYRTTDPFYKSETARRAFFDSYAFTGEVSYRTAGEVQENALPTALNNLAFSLRFDYQLASRLDLSAIVDAVGGSSGRTLSLSWIVLKYYRYLDDADYAFRLAVDPASDGRVGFPQIDFAFLYNSLVAPDLSYDLAVGMRRVNIGYAQLLPAEPLPAGSPIIFVSRPRWLYTRALGTEAHMAVSYSWHFDPAASNLFFGVLGEAGSYELVETPLSQSATGAAPINEIDQLDKRSEEGLEKTPYLGGVAWLRAGIEFNRPRYQVSPFAALRLAQYVREDGEDWAEPAPINLGVRLMLR